MATGTIKAVVAKGDVANNLTTTDAGKVLDARQGKVLGDQIGDVRDAYDIGTQTSLSGLQTALANAAASMNMGESKLIRFLSGSSGFETFMASVRYYGYLFCTYISGTRIDFCITFTSNFCDSISMGRQNGTWYYNDVIDQISELNAVRQKSYSIPTTGKTILFSGVSIGFVYIQVANNPNQLGLYMYYGSSANCYVREIVGSSYVTVAATTGGLVFTNTSSAARPIRLLAVSGYENLPDS